MSDDATIQDAIRRDKPISATRAAALLEEAAAYRNANSLAAQAFVEIEARLMQATERNGYLERMLHHLRDAARPAATALSNIAQLPGIDDRIKETIQQTLAPLDAALAATKGGNE